MTYLWRGTILSESPPVGTWHYTVDQRLLLLVSFSPRPRRGPLSRRGKGRSRVLYGHIAAERLDVPARSRGFSVCLWCVCWYTHSRKDTQECGTWTWFAVVRGDLLRLILLRDVQSAGAPRPRVLLLLSCCWHGRADGGLKEEVDPSGRVMPRRRRRRRKRSWDVFSFPSCSLWLASSVKAWGCLCTKEKNRAVSALSRPFPFRPLKQSTGHTGTSTSLLWSSSSVGGKTTAFVFSSSADSK